MHSARGGRASRRPDDRSGRFCDYAIRYSMHNCKSQKPSEPRHSFTSTDQVDIMIANLTNRARTTPAKTLYNTVTLIFELLNSGSMRGGIMPNLVLMAQTVFLSERGNTQTHTVTDATDHRTHASATAGLTNKKICSRVVMQTLASHPSPES